MSKLFIFDLLILEPNDCECYKRIHRECNYEMNFTEQEIQNARLYPEQSLNRT
jgi:hypothetical protein